MTDSSGNMRIQRVLPSNKVNSREVRRVVEEIIDESEVKPSTIRFFRGAMFNMVGNENILHKFENLLQNYVRSNHVSPFTDQHRSF